MQASEFGKLSKNAETVISRKLIERNYFGIFWGQEHSAPQSWHLLSFRGYSSLPGAAGTRSVGRHLGPRLRLQSHCSFAFSAAFVTFPFLDLSGVDFKKVLRCGCF